MQSILKVAAFFLVVIFSSTAHAQPNESVFQNAEFVMTDGTTTFIDVNARELLVRNRLISPTGSAGIALSNVQHFMMDSIRYDVRKIVAADTFKIMEKTLDGKISVYRSPRLTTKEEIFVEKDGKTYEMRIVKKQMQAGKFAIKEYASYLQSLMLDCSAIDRKKIANNIDLSLPAIVKLVTQYNKNCGWQKEMLTANKNFKPRLFVGVMAGALIINHRLSYSPGFRGESKLMGLFIGPTLGLEFRKFFDTRVNYDLLFEKSSGSGTARFGSARHEHSFNMMHLKNIVTFNVNLFKQDKIIVRGGLGTVAVFQLGNKSTYDSFVSDVKLTGKKPSYYASNDKFNLAPVGQVNLAVNRLGFQYQIIPLSIQMRKIELFGIEHRMSIQYNLKRFD